MKTITIDLTESVLDELEAFARRHDRPTEDVVREVIESYRLQKIEPEKRRKSVLDHPVYSVGGILRPLGPDDDLLGEMLDRDE